jgi:hypothetical protein
MKYAVRVASCGIIYMPSFMQIGIGVQAILSFESTAGILTKFTVFSFSLAELNRGPRRGFRRTASSPSLA